MGLGFAPTWLRQVSPLLHKTTLTTERKDVRNLLYSRKTTDDDDLAVTQPTVSMHWKKNHARDSKFVSLSVTSNDV